MGYASDVIRIGTAVTAGGMAWSNDESEAALVNFASAGGSLAFAFGKYHTKNQAWKDAFKQELWVIEVSIMVLTILELVLLGNANEKGQKFKTASKDFKLALKSLEDAVASSKEWSGSAADAYNTQNTEQMERVQDMVELDPQVATILTTETGQVKEMRNVSAECRAALTGCIPLGYYILAMWGKPACWAFQVAAALSVLGTADYYYGTLKTQVDVNRDDVNELTVQYQSIADAAAAAITLLSQSAPATTVAKASTSTVSQFETSSAAPASAPYTPAAAPAGPEPERAPLYVSAASTGEEDGPSDDSPVNSPDNGAPPAEGDVPESDVPPAYTAPTLSQVVTRASEASTQVAKFSEEAAVTVSLVSDVVGTVEQISSMAQSAAPAPVETEDEPPVAEQPAETDDMVALGVEQAAAGTDNPERAPAGGAEAAAEAGSVERV